MTYISRERLLKSDKSLYKLVLAAAARANQLSEGAKPLIDDSGLKKIATVALREIAADKVSYISSNVGKKSGNEK